MFTENMPDKTAEGITKKLLKKFVKKFIEELPNNALKALP